MSSENQDPRLILAAQTIAKQLGVNPDAVTASVGLPSVDGDYHIHASRLGKLAIDPENTENLVFTIHTQGLDLERPRLEKEYRDKLAGLAPLAEVAQMVPQEQMAAKLKAELEAAVEGTNFNKKLFEWPGFDAKLLKEGVSVQDYALQNVTDNTYGITFKLRFPDSTREDQSAAIERFTEITTGRLESIKEILTDRVVKYAKANITERGLNEQEKQEAQAKAQAAGKTAEEGIAEALSQKIAVEEANIRAKMAKLEIAVNRDGNQLSVTMRSPEQKEAYDKADPQMRDYEYGTPPANADDLRNTNPLTSRIVALTTQEKPATETTREVPPQLHRALARAFLFDKDKNIAPDAVQVLGSRDMQAALIKELKLRVLPQHPEKTEELTRIINSDLFKNHASWHTKPGMMGVAKSAPLFEKPAKNGEDKLQITFTLGQDIDPEKNQLLQTVNKLAALSLQTSTAEQQPAIPGATQTVDTSALERAADNIIAAGQQLDSVAMQNPTNVVGTIAPTPGLEPGNPLRGIASQMSSASAAAGVGI